MFSLGSLLYALITGRPPFARAEGSVIDALKRIIAVDYRPVSQELDSSFDDVDRILSGCLQRYPGRRYPSVQHLIVDLGIVLEARKLDVSLSKFATDRAAAYGDISTDEGPSKTRPERRGPYLLLSPVVRDNVSTWVARREDGPRKGNVEAVTFIRHEPEAVEAFLDELTQWTGFDRPYLRFLEQGKIDDEVYAAFSYRPGITLGSLIGTGQPPAPPSVALSLVRQLAIVVVEVQRYLTERHSAPATSRLLSDTPERFVLTYDGKIHIACPFFQASRLLSRT